MFAPRRVLWLTKPFATYVLVSGTERSTVSASPSSIFTTSS